MIVHVYFFFGFSHDFYQSSLIQPEKGIPIYPDGNLQIKLSPEKHGLIEWQVNIHYEKNGMKHHEIVSDEDGNEDWANLGGWSSDMY